MTEDFPPRPVSGAATREISVTGALIPWGRDDEVVLLHMGMCNDFFLPVFSTEERLMETLGRAGVEFVRIKKIDDGAVFLSSLPLLYGEPLTRLRVILDPVFAADGKVRFAEIDRSAGEA